MFAWLRGKPKPEASKSTGRKTYNVNNYYTDGYTGRNDSFQSSKWGAAAAVMSTPYAFAIVNKIVADFEAIPYRIIRDDTGEVIADNENIGNDPLLTALDAFATRNDGFSLFGYWALHKFQTGEAYVELVRNDYGYPRGLDMLNSLFVTKDVTMDRIIFNYGAGGHYIRYRENELVFDKFRTNIFTDVDGTPPLLSNLNSGTLSALRSSGRAMLAYFENDGLPRALVTPTDASGRSWDTIEEQNNIKRALDLNKGAGGKYKTQIFPYPIDIAIFDPPDLTQWMGGTEQAEKYVFSVYGIPPSVVGLSFDTRYQVSEQDVPNYKRTMRSYFESIQATVNTNLLPFFNYPPDIKFEFDLEAYATFDASLIDRANTAYAQGAISLNEYRRAMGFEVLDNADDVYMLPMGVTPLNITQIVTGNIPQPEPTLPLMAVDPQAHERMMQSELKAWRKVARKSVERAIDFECEYTPEWLEGHIKSALTAGMDVNELFDSIKAEITQDQLTELVSLWERLGLTRLVDSVEKVADDVQ